MAAEWTLLPAVVVRSAGFPWELVLSLAYPRAAETAATVVRLERQALDLLACPQDGGRLPRGLRARLRRLRPLPPGTPGSADWLADWNRVTGLLEEARLALADVVAADAARVRTAAAAVAADERFLDALVGSAPAAYRNLRRRATPPSNPAEAARRLAPYLQRLAAQCARTGFYAPIDFARIEPGRDSGYTWAGHRECARRIAYPASHIGEALQQRILTDPALVGALVPRRRTGTGAAYDGAAFAGHCDGRRTLAEIAAETGTGLERASAALAVAVRRGLLTHDLCPPATIPDPLAWLRDRLPGEEPPAVPEPGLLPARGAPAQRRRAFIRPRSAAGADLSVGQRVREIADLLERYPAASPDVKLAVQSRIEALAGGRRTGREERVVVYEAAAGTLHVTIGDPLAADLRDRVPRALGPLAEDAELTRLRTNRLLAGRLGPGTFDLAEALPAAGNLAIQRGDRIAGLVRDADPDAVALDLAELLGEPVAPAAPVVCAADVMVAAPSLEAYEPGVTPLVLDGLDDAPLLTPWELRFHREGAGSASPRSSAEGDGAGAAIARALRGFTALTIISPGADGLPSLELPGPVLESGGAAADPRRRRVGIDDLYVRSDGHRAVLHAKGTDEPLMFHNGEPGHALHTAFGLPRLRPPVLQDLPRTPRLTWGNVVISRRRWRLGRLAFDALGRAGGDRELLLAMARLRDRHDLPRTFFAAAERRPVYIDTRAPALIEELARLAGKAERLTLTETLPGPEECWLRDGGQRFAARLRCVYLRPAARAGEDG
ncbi:lantibiotic biosynthesis dehydratase-like protein [Nonomuraea polychroma]|uniref:Lantibiotic biosynthesis dehydratase-like protein n=1 Tax=Nonomuraea polychroma TaxID=46176 RepID=A0A438M8Y5_9ACTN|nr:lantibiotic dehydratase [Nonomuraea polychroma]RVX42181.1 lantibiotic biosynthesis dehydratase-like protein [Nonomuraea polychroma]